MDPEGSVLQSWSTQHGDQSYWSHRIMDHLNPKQSARRDKITCLKKWTKKKKNRNFERKQKKTLHRSGSTDGYWTRRRYVLHSHVFTKSNCPLKMARNISNHAQTGTWIRLYMLQKSKIPAKLSTGANFSDSSRLSLWEQDKNHQSATAPRWLIAISWHHPHDTFFKVLPVAKYFII